MPTYQLNKPIVTDWYTRAVDAGLKIQLLDEVLFRYKISDDNISIRERDLNAGYLGAIRATLARRSAASQVN